MTNFDKLFRRIILLLDKLIIEKESEYMKIRKMKFEDLKFVKDNFFYGKGLNSRVLMSRYTYVAVLDEKIIGFLFGDAMKSGTGIIFALEVLKDHRNTGVATKLIKKYEYEAKKNNITAIMLFYNKGENLDEFYKKFDFIIGDNLITACKGLN